MTFKQFIKSKKFKKLPSIKRIKKPGIYAIYTPATIFKVTKLSTFEKSYTCDLIIVDNEMDIYSYSSIAIRINPYLENFVLRGKTRNFYGHIKVEYLGSL